MNQLKGFRSIYAMKVGRDILTVRSEIVRSIVYDDDFKRFIVLMPIHAIDIYDHVLIPRVSKLTFTATLFQSHGS